MPDSLLSPEVDNRLNSICRIFRGCFKSERTHKGATFQENYRWLFFGHNPLTLANSHVFRTKCLYHQPQRSTPKVMPLQVCVIPFTGGEYLTRFAPPDQVTPGPGRQPLDQVHPPVFVTFSGLGTPPQIRKEPPQDQVHPQVHFPRTRYYPPGPGTLLWDQVHSPVQVMPPDQGHTCLREGGTHPTGMQSCFYLHSLKPIGRECFISLD